MRIAILLDLDNIKPKLSSIEHICQEHGDLVYRHAFSNTPAVLVAYGGSFREFLYRFELTPGLDPRPQEVDALIRRTAIELTRNRELQIEAIAIVSNDNGYADLFDELRRRNIRTIAIGGSQLGLALRQHANHVHFLDDVLRPVYLGIDLGTTNTVMSVANIALHDGQLKAAEIEVAVTNEQGAFVKTAMIPSSVRFGLLRNDIGGDVRAGAYAFRTNTVLAWKHDMGRSEKGKAYRYNLEVGKIAPEEAAAEVLKFCRRELQRQYSNGVQGVVITHPASYEADAVDATRRAAVLAGWREEEVVLLPEPHAALYDFLHRLEDAEINFPFDIQQPINMLVYDLGGGTLDISLHTVKWNATKHRFTIQDLAIGSRTRVGGDDVDELIAHYVLNNYAPEHLSSAERDELGYELRLYAEKFKRLWGAEYARSREQQSFYWPFRGNYLEGQAPIELDIDADIMRVILESLLCPDIDLSTAGVLPLPEAFDSTPFTDRFNSFVVPVLEILLKARQTLGAVPKIDCVLLNGGMTYFPLVRERLHQLFGATQILEQGHPDLAVARGAALYAAGAQGRAAQRVNPTNIYLEVKDVNESTLRILIRQGQTYPYRTQLSGFRLPDVVSGQLNFNVWVGMGSRANRNTTLQRTRQAGLSQIHAANLPPGALLDLEVEYTVDERLLLTLISRTAEGARFKLELARDEASIVSSDYQAIIPAIPRVRPARTISEGPTVTIKEWPRVVNKMINDWSNGELWARFRELESRIIVAENRDQIVRQLLNQLPTNVALGTMISRRSVVLCIRVIRAILKATSPEDGQYAPLEAEFKSWVSHQYTGWINTSSQQITTDGKQLLQELGETPGLLLWFNWDDLLIEAFNCRRSQAQAQVFLNSLGKCGRPVHKTLKLLRQVVANSPHLAHREKAAWSLARLISPGQPSEWCVVSQEVNETISLILDRLLGGEHEVRAYLSLLGCLYQCMAWQLKEHRFEPAIHKKIVELSKSGLASGDIRRYPDIQHATTQKLALLPQMLNIHTASLEDIDKIRTYLLETVRRSDS